MNNSTFYAVCSRMSTSLASCLSGQGGPPSAWGTLHIKACVPLLAARKHAHDPCTILRMVGRHHSRNYAHPYAPGGFIHLYIYVHTHTHRHTCCMQRRVRKQAARVIPFSLPRPFPFERQSRHAMIFHFPRHPPWNTSTPVVERGLKSIRPSRELESPVGGYRDGWSDRLPFIRILAREGNIFKAISR